MRVLIVCSVNSGKISPFIQEQADALSEKGIEIDSFLIKKKGLHGYLQSRKLLINKIIAFNPDIVHAHYGLSCLLATLQRRVPVISTFHGSDINNISSRFFSQLAILLSRHTIFVSNKLKSLVLFHGRYSLIPCGVNFDIFFPQNKNDARTKMGFNSSEKLVLFSNSFSIAVKNYPLAKAAIEDLKDVRLLELKNYSRETVCILLNACDVALMTSFTEGSPQFIKEAMACNCPIVSTDVGDVKELLANADGCYISSYEKGNVRDKISLALALEKRTNCRQQILNLDNKVIAARLIEIYKLYI